MKTFIATSNDQGRTIWKYCLKVLNNVPTSRLEKIFRKKDIKVNNKRNIKKNYIVQEGDVIVIYDLINVKKESEEYHTKITFDILFEDENVLIVNKPNKVVVHGGANSLDNQVLSYLKWKSNDSFIPSHMSRIDKETSGIVVYGKNYKTLVELKNKLKNFIKIYEFQSDLDHDITTKIMLGHNDELQQEVEDRMGKLAITHFYIKNNKQYARLETGRKHQIRASLKILGYPIKGDVKYGGMESRRMYLHFYYLKFLGLENGLEYLNNKEIICTPNW